MSDNSSRGGGITFLGALQVLFIGLKLAGCIDWPWYAVLAPLILEFGVLIAVILSIFIAYVLGF